jgi:polyhydroxyalkanoate synthesis repressor PhaR
MVSGEVSDSAPPSSPRRIIKRYSNRKLYDTKQSSYVTLLQIAELVRAGEDVQIIDNATKEDKTDITLALIISEELKTRPRAIPLGTLRALIRMRGGQLLSQLREGPIGRLIPRDEHDNLDPGDPTTGETSEETPMNKENPFRRTLEQWQQTIDERVRTLIPHLTTSHLTTLQDVQAELRRLSDRLAALEKRVESQPDKRLE